MNNFYKLKMLWSYLLLWWTIFELPPPPPAKMLMRVCDTDTNYLHYFVICMTLAYNYSFFLKKKKILRGGGNHEKVPTK